MAQWVVIWICWAVLGWMGEVVRVLRPGWRGVSEIGKVGAGVALAGPWFGKAAMVSLSNRASALGCRGPRAPPSAGIRDAIVSRAALETADKVSERSTQQQTPGSREKGTAGRGCSSREVGGTGRAGKAKVKRRKCASHGQEEGCGEEQRGRGEEIEAASGSLHQVVVCIGLCFFFILHGYVYL